MRFDRATLAAAAMLALSACAGTRPAAAPLAVAPSDTAEAPAPPRRIDHLDRTSREALERAIAAGRLQQNRFIYSVVLADDAARFDTGRASLSPSVRRQLAGLVEQLRSDSAEVYLEIQGHTDAVGSAERNRRLGLRRAETVRRFLSGQGLAPQQMGVVSYGEDVPVAPNEDAAGRAVNRRVVIVVLS